MFAANRHLDDRALIRRYLAERGLEALGARDESLLRHLSRCAACHQRYAALHGAFDDARHAMIERTDAVFSADRLAEQRDRILRRIDAQTAGPRVLPFPSAAASSTHASPSPVMRRWIAAAAVAGLVIGLAAGRYLHVGSDQAAEAQVAVAAPAHSTPAMRTANTTPSIEESDFLWGLDASVASPRADELRAIYAFTIEAPPREAMPVRVSTQKN